MKQTSSSTEAWEMASSPYVISMTLQTPEVTHFSSTTPKTDTLIKTTPRGKLWSSTTEVPPKIGRKKHIKTCLVPDFSNVYFLQVVHQYCYGTEHFLLFLEKMIRARARREIFVNRLFNTTSPSLL